MRVTIINESGYYPSMFGLGLSYGLTSSLEFNTGAFCPEEAVWLGKEDVLERARYASESLAGRGLGHDKFLESIAVWIDIQAPRYFWQEFDTYRVGVTKQSEATMHTGCKKHFTPVDFEQGDVLPAVLEALNEAVVANDLVHLKRILPEGYLQRRMVCLNYKTLLNMILQRKNHKLVEWRTFCNAVLSAVAHPELLGKRAESQCVEQSALA